MPRRSDPELAKRLGARLAQLRAEAGQTQEETAWGANVTKGYLSQVEAGLRLPSVAILAALAEQLGVTLVDVFAIDDPERELLDALRRGAAKDAKAALARLLGR